MKLHWLSYLSDTHHMTAYWRSHEGRFFIVEHGTEYLATDQLALASGMRRRNITATLPSLPAAQDWAEQRLEAELERIAEMERALLGPVMHHVDEA